MENDNYEYVDINEHLNKMFKQKVIEPTEILEKIINLINQKQTFLMDTQMLNDVKCIVVRNHLFKHQQTPKSSNNFYGSGDKVKKYTDEMIKLLMDYINSKIKPFSISDMNGIFYKKRLIGYFIFALCTFDHGMFFSAIQKMKNIEEIWDLINQYIIEGIKNDKYDCEIVNGLISMANIESWLYTASLKTKFNKFRYLTNTQIKTFFDDVLT